MITQLVENLRSTEQALFQAKDWYIRHPESRTARMSFESIQDHRQLLMDRLRAAVAESGVEACSYRYLIETETLPLSGMTKTLDSFQSLMTWMVAAVISGPQKRTATLSIKDRDVSNLGFSHCFAGSIGLILIPENQTSSNDSLLKSSILHDAIDYVIALAESSDSHDILEQTKKLGHGPVFAFRRWIKSHSESQLPVELGWWSNQIKNKTKELHLDDFDRLIGILNSTTDRIEEEIKYEGVVDAFEINKRRFSIRTENNEVFNGTLSPSFKASKLIPETKMFFYIKRSSRVNFSDNESDSKSKLEMIDCELVSSSSS